MHLWSEWWSWMEPLSDGCSRAQSFLWVAASVAGFSIRTEFLGISSVIRALGFQEKYYDNLRDSFHSDAVDPDELCRVWVRIIFRRLPGIYRFNGKPVLLGDGIKVPKRGRKMPGVKSLHQVSESNTKPEYIMGHSIQVVSVLVAAASSFFAVPLSARIHEGLVFSNRDQSTLMTKFIDLTKSLGLGEPFYLVADAYYACHPIAAGLLSAGSHLLTRLRKNSVAFEPVAQTGKKQRGRPKLYGKKIRLFSLFEKISDGWVNIESPVYGEKNVTIRYLSLDLVWKPIRQLARFVLVDHPNRGKIIFLCTDVSMNPVEIIRLYGLRFKIELSFKQAIRTIGVYAYHFWMMTMDKISSRSGDQYLHRKSDEYRNAVRRKMAAYHRHIQIGLTCQGVLQCISITKPALVWSNFGSWLCTIRSGIPPSELVVMTALRNSLPDFLAGTGPAATFRKFILERIDFNRAEGLRLAG